ncbi:MAG: hypothetical protein ACD_25C00269G0008 [uncultured bacterium]|uniref:Uncharacterized protein n=1 Tax=candidate division WWE3 bacterium TaxID=2053526 RepID=A0A656PNJ8_UNCKA|nr:hypothetical protein P147_WWE3C00001G0868 [candidate division WWE3 bacterium RAAC2_WWE3_1]EKD94649.1 MAG: hypothetical protein ACD_25C00269G0008 [uncultured bacterium]KKS29518.1 MAG: hypothetical protein UU91_C0005G0050 [candidate division WWE3 bacterium GW2011_GWB1_42_117]KKS54876.1 MAG: hypothetical protein UV21_C0004G0041 [candidate division WWE3 bacterium GW2011_GWD2_42_34]KKT05492.1 MAG: hypothetical protein UV83_C0003G0047 [candidate division WWE3 bacterium GW2011_GWE2_43_18]KKT06755.
MSTKTKKYQINEKDIDTVLNILKRTDPKHATPEMAIDILEHLQATFHTMRHYDPETLVKLYEELKKQKQLSRN